MSCSPVSASVASFAQKASELYANVAMAKTVLILTHDYPDPDCIASALGIAHLCSYWGVSSPVVSFGGFIGRAENRALVRFLNIEMIPFALVDSKEFEKIIMVDSFPGKGNVSLPTSINVDAVIDHHPTPDTEKEHTFFTDIRQDIGATSTIVTNYLIHAGCAITPKLATALFYGIKTDTGEMRRDVSYHDLEAYKYLFDNIDHHLLSLIENPERDVEFFRLLHRAADAAVYFDTLCYTHLGSVSSPDYIAEMADMFHSLEKVEWMICSGIFKNQIFFSIRTKNFKSAGKNAEILASKLGGSGGGHGSAAAGRIEPMSNTTIETMLDRFKEQMKEVFTINGIEPKSLLQPIITGE